MAAHSRILLGQVVSSKMKDAAKVHVYRQVLDTYVMQYFPQRSTVFAFDSKGLTKVGDIVLVKELEAKRTSLITHKLEKIIYGVGNVCDPITGKRCDSETYWDEGEREKLFKEDPSQNNILTLEETKPEKRDTYEHERMENPLMSLKKKDWKL